MELYTLTPNFFPKDLINEFTSVIWTERYSSAGDVQLVVPAIPSTLAALRPGTMLGLRGVKEIMMLETQSVENKLLTVTGSSLVKFLNEREAWFPNFAYNGTDTSVRLSSDYSENNVMGEVIANVVTNTVIEPVIFPSYWYYINLDWDRDKIPGLVLGRTDTRGTSKQVTFPTGPLYDGIVQLAGGEALGFKLYLESAQYHTQTYELRFATYRGTDRTSDQTDHAVVRFSPQFDSLTDVKELSSITDYKNTVYVFYKNRVSVHYIPTLPEAPTGFGRRVIMVEAPDIYLDEVHIPPFLQQVALDAMANHLYVQAVDGRVSSKNDYTFAIDYYLGDVIELEGFSGILSKARITEYIRSQDQFGEQEYPTLSVIDPLGTDYVPDLEPDDVPPEWENSDPTWNDWVPDDVDPESPTYDPGLDPRFTSPPTLDNPLDPYDFNPDPTPDFGPDGGSGDDSVFGDGDGTPGSRVATTYFYVTRGTGLPSWFAVAKRSSLNDISLLPNSRPADMMKATDLVVSPDKKNLYVMDAGYYSAPPDPIFGTPGDPNPTIPSRVFQFRRDVSSGAVALMYPASFTYYSNGGAGDRLIISPDGKDVYLLSTAINALGGIGSGADSVPGIAHYIRASDGHLSEAGETYPIGAILTTARGMTISPDGKTIYVLCNDPAEAPPDFPDAYLTFNGCQLLQVDRNPSDGTLSISTLYIIGPSLLSPTNVVASHDNHNVYVVNRSGIDGSGPGSIVQFSRASDGSLTSLSPLDGLVGDMDTAVVLADGSAVLTGEFDGTNGALRRWDRSSTDGALTLVDPPIFSIPFAAPGMLHRSPYSSNHLFMLQGDLLVQLQINSDGSVLETRSLSLGATAGRMGTSPVPPA